MKMSHILASFAIFSVAIAMFMSAYTSISQTYGLHPTDLDDEGKSIFEKIMDINFLEGMEDIITSAYELRSPTATPFDVLGSLKGVGVGFLKLSTGIITMPIELIGVITGFYYIPSEFATGMGVVFIIYIGFILVKKYLE